MTTPSPSLFLYLKLGIIGIALLGVFSLAALGRIDATVAIGSVVALVSSLAFALGISASGNAQAAATLAVGPASSSVTNVSTPDAPRAVTLVEPTIASLQAQIDALKVKAGQAGFGTLRLLGFISIVGVLLAIVIMTSGCLVSAPVVAVTPANQGQVSACQGTASLHNGVVIGDFALGGIGAGMAGSAAALTDTQAKTDLAIAAASVGGLLVIGTAVGELTASNFANSQCSAVVGALPTAPTPAGH